MSSESEIKVLADYIMADIPGEPSQNQGAGHTAVRLLRYYRRALDAIRHELGVPSDNYPAPVANASDIAEQALTGRWHLGEKSND